jgi:hypothetical protein
MSGSGPRAGSGALVAIILGFATSAGARWGPDGITVRETAAEIPMVVACSDGGTGTLVAWHEMVSKRAGFIRLQHVLAGGDLDPAWPAEGALASTIANGRTFLDMVPDQMGGAYLIWAEVGRPPSIFVTRVDARGQVADGWPAGGRFLGAVNVFLGRPAAIEDGAHWLYVAWTSGAHIYAERFGPDGHGAGGWIDGPRLMTAIGTVPLVRLWPALARAPDDGAYVGWATLSRDTTLVESGVYLRRITGAGANAPGWRGGGQRMASFRPEFLAPELPLAPLFDLAPDGRGGVFWFGGDLWGPTMEPRLRRITSDASTAPGWPAEGRPAPVLEQYGKEGDQPGDKGLRVHSDGRDGALLETRASPAGGPLATWLYRMSDGGATSESITGLAAGHEVVVKGDGGAFLADFAAHGRYDPGDPDAYLAVNQSNAPVAWAPWREAHAESVPWFGDIALATAVDEGVVLFWSQVEGRQGLFARRFTTAGQVTGIGPPSSVPTLYGLRFVSGAGVVARVAVEGSSGTFELFDLQGRLIATRTVQGPGSIDVTLPGTASLASGVYLARFSGEHGAALGKVAVIR